MDLITLAIALIVFVTIVIGFVVGNLFPVLRPLMTYDDEFGGNKQEKNEQEAVSEFLDDIDEVAPEPVAKKAPLPPPKPGYPKMVQVTRVFRDTEKYQLHVELDAELFDSTTAMNDEQKNVLSHTLAELTGWVGEEKIVSLPPAVEKPKSTRPANLVPPTGTLPKLDQEEEKPVEPIEVSINPVKLMATAVQANAQSQPKSRNIAEEINVILQAKLIGTSYESHGIEIAMTTDGTLAFVVGETAHEFMDEIENLEIRKLMQHAVKEWDESSDR